jgi:hypothetical protein
LKPAYILIDFENVQPDKIGALDAGAFKIKVFVGAKQSRVALGLASALQPMGNAVEYVQIEGSGRNALDLHIAYYIGRLSVEEPGAVFHIVSRDTDYDPLIDHLKGKKIHCQRWSSFGDIPHARAAAPKAAPAQRPTAKPKPAPKAAPKAAAATSAQVDEIVANLRKRARAQPSTLKALTSTIKSHFRKIPMTDATVETLVEALKARGLIAVDDGKVEYQLA